MGNCSNCLHDRAAEERLHKKLIKLQSYSETKDYSCQRARSNGLYSGGGSYHSPISARYNGIQFQNVMDSDTVAVTPRAFCLEAVVMLG